MSEEKQPDNHKPFSDMAERIIGNQAHGFGGAVVIVPPGEGRRIEILILDPRQDAAMFWGNIQAVASLEIADLEERARSAASPYGGQRR